MRTSAYARACACAGAQIIKFEKYELSAFTEKTNNKFGQKAKILQKNENAHEIRKKRPGLCPGVNSHFCLFTRIYEFLTKFQK